MGGNLVSVKPIRLFGDPVLRTPAEPVRDFDAELRRLVKDLTETMEDAPGVGLAAPQIGVGLRVFTYHIDDELGHLINPSLVLSEDQETDDEGCLSFPGLQYPTRRAHGVVATGVNMRGRPPRRAGACGSRRARWPGAPNRPAWRCSSLPGPATRTSSPGCGRSRPAAARSPPTER